MVTALARRVVFFGTPGIAVPALEALIASDHQVVAVVTAPDRPQGRGLKLQPCEVKELAASRRIPVLQPPTLRSDDVQTTLRELAADVFVVVAYGLILPVAVLSIPPLGCINVHFSLLPRWRGAAPVQWAILEGDANSGVAIMQMDPGLDTGPVLQMVPEPIRPEDTSATLSVRLASLGARLLPGVLGGLHEMRANPQESEGVTYASKLTPEDAHLDWSVPAEAINNRIRALNPRPGAWALVAGKRLKIWRAEPLGGASSGVVGLLSEVDGDLVAEAGTGLLRLTLVQPEGRTKMSGVEFVRGYGAVLPAVLD